MAYTYLHLHLYTYAFLMLLNLIKLLKHGTLEATTKFSRLKSIFSVQDN